MTEHVEPTVSDPMSLYRHRAAPSQGGDRRLLTLLHGTGGDAASFLEFGRALSPGAALLSLEGDVVEHGMRRFFRRLAEGVYDMADLAERTERLDRFLEAAIPAYAPQNGIAVGVGYSNGANILANLLLHHPRRLRRMALMHPLIPFAPPVVDLSGVSVLITAGRRDPICPPRLTESLRDALVDRGATVSLIWSPGGHEVSQDEVTTVRNYLDRAA